MNINRFSIGFGLRKDPKTISLNHVPNNQLLLPDATSPISADPAVWLENEEIELLTAGLLPDFANPLHLAKELDLLLAACRTRNIAVEGLWPICLTALEVDIFLLREQFGLEYFEKIYSEQQLVNVGWQFLGFDVVDLQGLISGLKGCGYVEPSRSQLRTFFGDDLNEVGLFKNSEKAFQFAEVRGLQIRAHAPFTVTGLLTRGALL